MSVRDGVQTEVLRELTSLFIVFLRLGYPKLNSTVFVLFVKEDVCLKSKDEQLGRTIIIRRLWNLGI
jgi:hypothetical protein